MTPEARIYLDEALDYIQEYSVKRERIDWPVLRQEASALVAHAQTAEETYSAIELAIQRLDDPHSRLIYPAAAQLIHEGKTENAGLSAGYPEGIIEMVYPGSPAEAADVQVGETIETINGQFVSSLTADQFRAALREAQVDLTLKPAGQQGPTRFLHLQAAPYALERLPQGRRLAESIGYLDLPELLHPHGEDTAYIEAAHRVIREIDQIATCGWVIDLRRNNGGGMWGMVAAVGPILGEGECLAFVAPWDKVTVLYRNGQALADPEGEISKIDEPYHLKRSWPSVAVLTSQITASASEFIVLAFRGRPHTRSFGEPTRGLPTCVDGKELHDGAAIALTTHLGADRTGRTYDCSLSPVLLGADEQNIEELS